MASLQVKDGKENRIKSKTAHDRNDIKTVAVARSETKNPQNLYLASG